jgi:hypothetical protein
MATLAGLGTVNLVALGGESGVTFRFLFPPRENFCHCLGWCGRKRPLGWAKTSHQVNLDASCHPIDFCRHSRLYQSDNNPSPSQIVRIFNDRATSNVMVTLSDGGVVYCHQFILASASCGVQP